MSLKKSNICIFSLNLEKFTPDRKFLHRHVCGVCDKYEVCSKPLQRIRWMPLHNLLPFHNPKISLWPKSTPCTPDSYFQCPKRRPSSTRTRWVPARTWRCTTSTRISSPASRSTRRRSSSSRRPPSISSGYLLLFSLKTDQKFERTVMEQSNKPILGADDKVRGPSWRNQPHKKGEEAMIKIWSHLHLETLTNL